MSSPRIKAHAAVLAANLFYGINFSVMKHVTASLMTPLALNVLRVTGATLFFGLFVWLNRQPARIARKDWPRLILCVFTGVIINQVLFIRGLSLTTPIHSALLMLVCPIAVVFIAALLGGEGIRLHKIFGLALGVTGAVMLVLLREAAPGSPNVLLGDILVVINAVSYAFYLVLVRPLMQRYNGMALLAWLFLLSTLILLPAGWNDCRQIEWAAFTGTDWLALVFIIVAVTILAYLFNIYSIKQLGSSVTGAYIYTQPVFAGIISLVYAGDQQHLLTKAIAALLIMGGVYLVSKRKAGA